MAQDGEAERRDGLIADVLALIRNTDGAVATAERWRKRGIGEISWWLTSIVQEAIRAKLAHRAPGLGRGAMHELAEWLDSTDWFRLLDACTETSRSLAAQHNLNEQLALERLALECQAAGLRASKARS